MSSYVNFSSRVMMGAAIVGIVGAAGVFIYEQIYAEKRRAMLVNEVARLDKQVATMRSELEALRELQKENQLRRLKQRRARRERKEPTGAGAGDAVDAKEQSYASDSEYFTDYQSVVGTDIDMDSEEFFDVNTDADDDDDDTLRDNRNGHSHSLDEDLPEKTDLPVSPKKSNST